jgi:small-conductance mechanosensitive channel
MYGFLTEIVDSTLLEKIGIVIGATIILFIIVRLVKRALNKRIEDKDARYRARKFVTLIGYIAILFVAGIVFSDKLGGLAVTLGVASAGVAFALQEVIVSFAGWLAVSLGGYYKVGDRIMLGGIKGDVIDIGLLRTTIMEIEDWIRGDQYNGRVVRVANSFIFKKPVFNYSGDFPFLWDEIVVPVRYGSEYTLAREILEKVAMEVTGDYIATARKAWNDVSRKYLVESARIEPAVMMVANDNWVQYTVRYVVEFKKRRSTKNDLFEKILTEFGKSKGKVEMASATFEMVGIPELNVDLATKPDDKSEE